MICSRVCLPAATAVVARRVVAPESVVLAAICSLDLLTTCFWVQYRQAAEGNPLMNWYLQSGGTAAFVCVKFVLFLLPLFIAEWARRMRPQFVCGALRTAIAAYVTLYGLGVAQLNQAGKGDPPAEEIARIERMAEQPSPWFYRALQSSRRAQTWRHGYGASAGAAAGAEIARRSLAE